MEPIQLLPLGLAAALVGLCSFVFVSTGWSGFLSRMSRLGFDRFVVDSPARKRSLEAAHVDQTYRIYASRTYLYTLVAGVAGGTLGVYLIAGTLSVLPAVAATLAQLPSVMGEALGDPNLVIVLSPLERDLLSVGGGVAVGSLAATLTYVLRWQIPQSNAEVRRRGINEALPRTVAFMYALSRGGTTFPTVMRTLGNNQEIYGDAAAEVKVGVRQMDLFSVDVISAIRRVAYRTPSEKWKTFSENLASVLQSGQSLPRFLQSQYERYQEEAEERQKEVLELLATIAEAYVTVLVAGMLFLVTILLVFGLTTTDTLPFIRMIGYLIIPLANLGFMLFLMQKLEQLGIARESGVSKLEADDTSTTAPETSTAGESRSKTAPETPTTSTDGGTSGVVQSNLAQLRHYDRASRLKRVLGTPLQTIMWHPTRLLYVTVPLALLWIGIRMPEALAAEGLSVRVLDDILIQAGLFVLGTFAIVREVYKRRIDRIEAATPELLERLASLNEAGMSVVESLDRVRDSDLDALGDEVDRIWSDVEMGANVQAALVRFGRRVRTTSIARIVTLLTNAMHASGRIGPVLRIAATQARSDLRMRRQRRQQMFTYLVVIYISFFVFLVIIIAVQEVLIPALPESIQTPEGPNRLGVNAQQFARLGEVDKAAYALVFFHTALVQAVFSGFIAGQLGEGTLKDGAKHAAVMLAIAYVALLLLSSPVASINFGAQPATDGEQITIESVSMSDGGFVVVSMDTRDRDVLGRTEYLPPGTHRNVVIPVDSPPDRAKLEVVAIPHLDTNDNRRFDYDGNETDRPYPAGSYQVSVEATLTYNQSASGDSSTQSLAMGGVAAGIPKY
ncbi:type II secretion system F family protein [Halapricum hydrolyticum]|uniref:Type II secretion system F family protein n=1 Tax=Halapricum hydrolyticum TaxID=2979991 RepID=A0AAE3LEU6_9EURY|nr:type II secretion system F family protein [Halapricum hydrolyticum]MCU4717376.1 type II secretion system F family protein [Halapricum hydrolyticum]MCU4726540.1 type II secretion system F family protein [Halapricum hydrolyticum]